MTVDEIRKELVETFGLSHTEVNNIKGKTNLMKTLLEQQELCNDSDDLCESVVEEDEQDEIIQDDEISFDPNETSPEWSDYVLGHLTSKEKVKDNPTADGLRRLTKLLIGEIISIRSDVINVGPDNAAVKVSVTVDNAGRHKTFDGCAETTVKNNNKSPYNLYMLATAETMAESRALKRCLGLRKVLTADEVAGNETDLSAFDETNNITAAQIKMLDNMAKRLNINMAEFLNNEWTGEEPQPQLLDISYEKAVDLCKKMTGIQTGGIENIPKKLIGYSNNWKE